MRDFIEKLETLVKKDIDTTNKVKITIKAYDNPNWMYRQADTNGYLRAMNNILKFVDQYKQKEKETKSDRLVDAEYTKDGPIISGPPTRPDEVIFK